MNEGKTIGHYRILRPLGKGGMGEVYLADDTKLQRQVALKFLPDTVRNDPERLARFRREALAAASLKHPNIATIYALEDIDDHTFIVMEYVEGETLSAHILPEGMSLDMFFATFIPLADALAHAHEHGRIHRDLKPGNIMIGGDGTPKILDFGLARILNGADVSEIDSDAPTVTMKADAPIPEAPVSLTQGRQFLGTPAYMSPEQIERKKVDARSDLFSFGVVMYEAITGQRPFKGETIESIIGRILTEEPKPVSQLKPITPYTLWSVIRNCLKKDQDRRTQTARELHEALQDVWQEVSFGTVLVDVKTIQAAAPAAVSLWRQPSGIAAIAAATLIIGFAAAWLLRPAPEPPLRRFQLLGQRSFPVISPDGRHIAYTQGGALWVRDLQSTEPRKLTDTAAGGSFWSPASDAVGYYDATGRTLNRVPVQGGPDARLCPVEGTLRGAAWGADGTVVFSAGGTGFSNSLYAVSAQGGQPRVFLQPDSARGERSFTMPRFLPDGKTLVFSALTGDGYWALTVQSGATLTRLMGGGQPGEFIMRIKSWA